jgi:hypothetical protein
MISGDGVVDSPDRASDEVSHGGNQRLEGAARMSICRYLWRRVRIPAVQEIAVANRKRRRIG